jgi:hypothetical protein
MSLSDACALSAVVRRRRALALPAGRVASPNGCRPAIQKYCDPVHGLPCVGFERQPRAHTALCQRLLAKRRNAPFSAEPGIAMRKSSHVIMAVLLLISAGGTAHAGDFSVIVNGKSFHHGSKTQWNEANYGFGLEYERPSTSRWKTRWMVNSFLDSNEDVSHMAGGGLYRRIYRTDRLQGLYIDVGLNAFLMTRKDINDGRPFPGALPSLSLGNRYIGVNLTWLPGQAYEALYDGQYVDKDMNGIAFLQVKMAATLFGFAD